jgi:hypothetical protein
MKDVELRAQLMRLGMPAPKADEVTRQLRDIIHPVAATAAAKMRDHQLALEQYAAYGDAGLSGYEIDELSGLFKSIKKAAKKVVGVVKKVALPVAAAVAAPFTGGASLAVLATTGAVAAGSTLIASGAQKKIQRKQDAANNATVAAQIQPGMLVRDAGGGQYRVASVSPSQISLVVGNGTTSMSPVSFAQKYTVIGMAPAVQQAPGSPVASVQPVKRDLMSRRFSSPKTPPQQVMNDPAVPPVVAAVESSQTENLSEKIGKYRRVKVPKPLAEIGSQVATQAVQQGYPADPASLISAMLANQGTNMVSPAARDVVSQVAAQGIEQTPAGPSALPSWALPVGAGALVLVMATRKRA